MLKLKTIRNHPEAAIFVFGTLVSAAVVLLMPQKAPDSYRYLAEARNLADKLMFSLDGKTPTCFDAPLYPAFLALLWSVFGRADILFMLSNCVIHGLTAVFSFSLAEKITGAGTPKHGRFSGWTAGIAVSVYPGLLGQTAFILTESLYTLFLVLAINFAVKNHVAPKVKTAAVCGLFFALSSLTRPVSLLFPPLLFLVWMSNPEKRKTALALLAAFILPVAAWAGRNAYHFKAFVPVSLTRHTLWMGSLEKAGGEWDEQAIRQRLDELEGLDPIEKDRRLTKEALVRYAENPAMFFRMFTLKLKRYALGLPGDRKTLKAHPLIYRMYQAVYFSTAALFLIGAVFLMFRRAAGAKIVTAYILYEMLALSAGFVMPRFRLPVIPLAVTIACAGIISATKALSDHKDRERNLPH